LTEHFDGTTWCIIASPNPTSGQNFLSGITALPTGTVAVGFAIDNSHDLNNLFVTNGADRGTAAPQTIPTTDPLLAAGVGRPMSAQPPAPTAPATAALDSFFAFRSADDDNLVGGLLPTDKRRR
jgi:hypothetical protein